LYRSCYPTPDGDYGKWAKPDVDSIAQAMLDVYKGYEYADYKAKDSEFIIKSQYSWVKSAEKALKILENQRLSDVI
jgi:glycosyltransferase involved in cell wall biosynthesis